MPVPEPVRTSPVVTSAGVDFHLPDAWGIEGIRLEVDFPLVDSSRREQNPEFVRTRDDWSLHLARPAVDRLEYQFTIRSAGHTEWTTDPGNPDRVPNPFGDKSEIRFPEYREPTWLTSAEVGTRRSLETEEGALAQPVPVTLWAPEDLDPDLAVPLLVAHDGSDLARRGSLLRWAAHAADTRPFRIAMLDPVPGHRDQWYAADPDYAEHLAAVVLPAIRSTVAVGATVGLGASLGGLSMLHLQRCYPDLLDALVLQSGSFFTRRFDSQESGYRAFHQVCAAVTELADGPAGVPVPVLMTCGTVEENLANNEQMARSLATQGYPVEMQLVPDAHTMIGWRDSWSPGLETMIDRVGGARRKDAPR